MKLRNVVGFVAIAVVAGCSTTAQDIEMAPVRESFVVDETLSDLYYRLTSTTSDDPACADILKSQIYPERGEFRVYYGVNMATIMGSVITNHNVIYASGKGETTTVVLKKTSSVPISERFTRKLTNFVKTGRCE